jgi:amino acid transporter
MSDLESKHTDEKATPPSPEGVIGHHGHEHNLDEGEGLTALGYTPELRRNRSLFTLLFQTLAIAAIPYGEGGPFATGVLGGGQLPLFLGWIVVCILDECVALSLAELASRYPTSAGPYYWAFQVAKTKKTILSFITGWIWLVGNWTITLSVNFGFASLIAGTVSMYHPDWAPNAWVLLLIFYAICLLTFAICAFGNKFLPMVDTVCAAWTAISIFIIMVALAVKADVGRHSASYALGHYDKTLSGWGGFSFFIGLLPAAYTFSAIGMISSMAEEVADPAVKVPKAIALCVPVGGIAGLFFIIPINVTMPPLADIIAAPFFQAIPYIFNIVMGSPGGGLGLTFLVLGVTMFCSISITVAASRCTWAFARDEAIPGSKLFSKVNKTLGVPIWALALTTLVQMLLGLIDLGSTSAFNAFVSVGVIALQVAYAIPIGLSLIGDRRVQVNQARWKIGNLAGTIVNVISLLWIAFEVVLFCMPSALPVTKVSMNYASVVLVGFGAISAAWYFIHARKGKNLHFSFCVTHTNQLCSLQGSTSFGWSLKDFYHAIDQSLS